MRNLRMPSPNTLLTNSLRNPMYWSGVLVEHGLCDLLGVGEVDRHLAPVRGMTTVRELAVVLAVERAVVRRGRVDLAPELDRVVAHVGKVALGKELASVVVRARRTAHARVDGFEAGWYDPDSCATTLSS